MKSYSMDLRLRVIAEVDRNERSIEEIAELFDISDRTIYNWLDRRRETNSVEPLPHGGGNHLKITEERQAAIAEFVKKHPDAIIDDIRQMVEGRYRITVSVGTIWNALDRLNLTVKKKTRRAAQADPEQRAQFVATQRAIDVHRVKFIDEFSIRWGMSSAYARSPRGERAIVSEPFRSGPNYSVIAAMDHHHVGATMMIEGAVDRAVLEAYVEHILLPELQPGDILIWDNLPVHRNARIVAMIEHAGVCLEPLPSYCPDLNPIEECISKIKSILRRISAMTERTLQNALRYAIDAISPENIHGWIRHAGYYLP